MDKPLNHYMKLGTIAFMSYPAIGGGEGDVESVVAKLAADAAFTAVEMTMVKDPAVRARVAARLKEAGMTVCYGAQPRLLTTGMNINDLDEAKRAKALASLMEGLDEAAEFGAVGLAFLSGPYEEATKEQSYQALLASTGALCTRAKELGLRVELEVFDYNVDKKSLIGPTVLARRFAEDVRRDYDNFGLLVDLSHFPLIGETVAESIYPVREFITHAHIGNAVVTPGLPAFGDNHPRFGFPGSANGMDDLVEYLRALLDIGFLNTAHPPVVSFEVKPFAPAGEDPDAVLAGCKRFLDEAWRLV